MLKQISFEVKYKQLTKTNYFKALQSFNRDEGITDSYLINNSLNTSANGIKYLQAILIEKIFRAN